MTAPKLNCEAGAGSVDMDEMHRARPLEHRVEKAVQTTRREGCRKLTPGGDGDTGRRFDPTLRERGQRRRAGVRDPGGLPESHQDRASARRRNTSRPGWGGCCAY